MARSLSVLGVGQVLAAHSPSVLDVEWVLVFLLLRETGMGTLLLRETGMGTLLLRRSADTGLSL